MRKILILGSSGMAGHIATLYFREKEGFEVIAVARSQGSVPVDVLMDVTDFNQLKEVIATEKPDVVLNCIGVLNQFANNYPDNAILVNSYLPHFLEAVTKDTQTKVIHISTDCVFSGKEGGYKEDSFQDGADFYAKTKALGELKNGKDLTIRTSIIGPELKNGIGLFHWFMSQSGEVNGFTKAYWTGVTTIELIKAVDRAIEENITGLYHLVYSEKINKYDLLNTFNSVFEKGLIVNPKSEYSADKSLINTRTDFSYTVNNYQTMVEQMKLWMENHKEIYSAYLN